MPGQVSIKAALIAFFILFTFGFTSRFIKATPTVVQKMNGESLVILIDKIKNNLFSKFISKAPMGQKIGN